MRLVYNPCHLLKTDGSFLHHYMLFNVFFALISKLKANLRTYISIFLYIRYAFYFRLVHILKFDGIAKSQMCHNHHFSLKCQNC